MWCQKLSLKQSFLPLYEKAGSSEGVTRPRPPATGPSGLRGRVPAHRRTVCCLGQRWPRCPVRSLRPAQATACASVSPADRLRSPCPSASWPWAQIAARGARVRLQLSFRPCRLFSEFLGELLRPAHAGSLSLGRTPGRPALVPSDPALPWGIRPCVGGCRVGQPSSSSRPDTAHRLPRGGSGGCWVPVQPSPSPGRPAMPSASPPTSPCCPQAKITVPLVHGMTTRVLFLGSRPLVPLSPKGRATACSPPLPWEPLLFSVEVAPGNQLPHLGQTSAS